MLHHAWGQGWEVFDMAGSGFPSNRITALAEGADGAIWVGTDWGLVHGLDGAWTIYQQAGSGLPDNSVRCLTMDAQDRLWVGTTNGGIGILDHGQWSVLNTGNSPLVIDEVSHIAHDDLGRTWIATPMGLHRVVNGEWVLYNDTPGSHEGHVLFGPNMAGTSVRSDGLAAVYTRNAGLIYIDGSDVLYYTSFSSNFPDNSGNGLAFDENGDRWLASATAGLIWHFGPYDEPAWMRFDSFTAGLPDNTLTCIVIGPDGRKYLGSETAGVILFDGPGQWTTLDQANSGLPDDRVRCMLRTNGGDFWVGTDNGGLALRMDPLQVQGKEATHFSVYPNPVRGPVHINSTKTTQALIWRLFDATGALIASGEEGTATNWTMDMAALVPGLYLLVLGEGRSCSVHRIVRG